MPTFLYTSRDQDGKAQTGQIDAINQDEVVAILQQRGLLVTSIAQKGVRPQGQRIGPARGHRRHMHAGVKVDDQVLLCQQLATMVEAGVPLLRALEVVSRQVESRALLLALDEVRRDVSAGRTLKEALGKHPKIFSPLWLNLVETGEASGHLAESLKQLVRHFEAARHLQQEVQTATLYPMILVGAAILVLLVFVYWVIPKFTEIFNSFGVELPGLTKFIIGVSKAAMRKEVMAGVFGGGTIVMFGTRHWLRTEGGQWTRDRLLLVIPFVKKMVVNIQLAEFSRGLATLLESGVPLLTSLEILERSATNKVYGQVIRELREAVKEGKTMAEPMDRTGRFSPLTVQMVQVGEEVGELAKMMTRIAAYYEEQMELLIARMTRVFEPVAIVVMGGLVLVIVMSIFLPIFELAGSAGSVDG